MIFATRFLLPCFLLSWALLLSATAYGEDEQSEAAAIEEKVEEKIEVLERVSPQTDHKRHQSIIDHLSLYQRQREVVELVSDDESFHGLFLQETMGRPQGGILLLHDNQQHAQWPTIVGPLRQYLPDYGWATLAIELPSQPVAPLPERPSYDAPASSESSESEPNESEQENTQESDAADAASEEDNNEETSTTDDPDSASGNASGQPEPPESENTVSDPNNEPELPRLNGLPPVADNTTAAAEPQAIFETSDSMRYQQQMRNRVTTSMDYLRSRGQLNLVVIANGSSASWAVNYLLNQQQSREADAEESIEAFTLILIDALQSPHDQLYLEEQLTQLEIPILDLVTDYSQTQPEDAKRRAGMMRHRQRDDYRQLQISATDLSSDQHQQVKRRVRGWLRSNAAGSELPVNR
ncbi:DUF3530 family protein [Bacterioplanoides sp.]|uniref:DUF3530 family protein n=1 Tax=Bacterioplanoides sp. TaxID=2066072 RepID=UPI003B000FDB